MVLKSHRKDKQSKYGLLTIYLYQEAVYLYLYHEAVDKDHRRQLGVEGSRLSSVSSYRAMELLGNEEIPGEYVEPNLKRISMNTKRT